RWVGHGAPKLRAPAPLLLRVAHLEMALIGDGNRIHVLERYRPALALVALELSQRSLAAADRRELLRQIERIVDAAVHSHTAERIVEMRRVAGEKYASAPIGFGDALMHGVERAVRDLVAPGLGV